MRVQVTAWEQVRDRRSEFLSCYQLMTENMLAAIQAAEFLDPVWVAKLLNHFAGYYFNALEAYESASPATPAVWQQAFEAARLPDLQIVQNLMLGMNAHINYDLTFALVDMLEMEWHGLSGSERDQRFRDHCHVNTIIHRTIDAVQDGIIEPQEPVFEIIDQLFGPVDEWAISVLVTHWRGEVWQNAVRLLETEPAKRNESTRQIETAALKRSQIILRWI
jgi:hypothetical protein